MPMQATRMLQPLIIWYKDDTPGKKKKKKKKDKATVNFGPFQKGKVKNISVNRLLRRSSKHIFYSEAGARTACSVSPVSASGPHHP